ncbi:MAG: alpha/beta hydrolase-fold protein [Candidatus Cloacimonadota bacterium]|nr:alpha/beta hydrolase-fold protein [Candidatus Cloacimonadota bacterium]
MLLSLSISYAQKKTEFIKGGKVSIESKILGEKRIMTVYLPESYNSGSQKYPVLYLLDGRAHFYHTTSAVNFLSNRGITPQIIVVAVYNVDRNRDFLPSHVERIPTSGGAEKFLNFISDELTEYIDNNYRTSNFSVLMGHSFGGTFATYSLLTKPELFDAYIAVSPFLHYDDNYLVKEAGKTQHSDFKGQKYFYMTIGDEPNYYSALGDFSSIINEKYSEIIDLDYVKMESEDHATTPYLSVFNGLRFIFSDWQIPASELEQGLSAVDEYYKNLSAKYEMEVTSSENLLNRLGYTYLQNEDIENAIMVFKENVKRYPKSSNVYDSLGEAYEKNDQLDLALKNYKIAYDLGMKENHVNTGVYLKNLKRVQQK